MKIGILNSESYFEQTENGWEFVAPSECRKIKDDNVANVLDEYADCLDGLEGNTGIDLNRTDEPEVQILNNWLDSRNSNKFFNGKEVNKENFLSMIRECVAENWKNSDLQAETQQALEKIANGDYEGNDEDIEGILEKLNAVHGAGMFKGEFFHPEPNLIAIENIISEGEWYFQE